MSKYQVRQFNPARQRVFLAIGSVIFLAIVAVSFWFGKQRATTDHALLEERVELLNEQLNALGKLKQTLLEEKTLLQRSNELDKTAMQAAKEALAESQAEMVELKEELTFYQSLLSPEERKPGLNITSLHLEPAAEAGRYKYTLVLSQIHQNDRKTKGQVKIGLAEKVVAEDEDAADTWNVTTALDDQRFAFKFFQRIEGEITLPEGLENTALLVQVAPVGNRLKPVSQDYNWNLLIGGSS